MGWTAFGLYCDLRLRDGVKCLWALLRPQTERDGVACLWALLRPEMVRDRVECTELRSQ